MNFFESMGLNLSTTGNFYGAIDRRGQRIVSILPLASGQMDVRLLRDGSKSFEYTDSNGNLRVFSEDNIWHVMLPGNGVVGYSPLQYAAHSLGISISSNTQIGNSTKNGGKPTGVLMVDRTLKPEQRSVIRKNHAELTLGNDDNLFVLEADMKYQTVSMTPSDMQMIQTRQFQVADIARFMGVPSVLINDLTGTTSWGSGIEQIIEGWYKLNLRPYFERIESSIKRNLMPVRDQDRIKFDFDFEALLRVDFKSRLEGYNKAINSAVLTPNEARDKENLKPMDGGDQLYINSTLVPLDQASEPRDNNTMTLVQNNIRKIRDADSTS